MMRPCLSGIKIPEHERIAPRKYLAYCWTAVSPPLFWGCPGHFARSSRGNCKRWIPTLRAGSIGHRKSGIIYAQGVLLMRKLLFSLRPCFKYCRSAADQPKPDQLGRAGPRLCDLYKPDYFAKYQSGSCGEPAARNGSAGATPCNVPSMPSLPPADGGRAQQGCCAGCGKRHGIRIRQSDGRPFCVIVGKPSRRWISLRLSGSDRS
jgi:hypothetical protein